jgi:hypothetical protein
MIVNAAERNHVSAKRRAFRRNRAVDALLEGAREQGQTVPGGPDDVDVASDTRSSHNIPSHSRSSPRRRALRRSP